MLDAPLSQADMAVHLARLTAASLAFEERYAHLTEEGRARAKALQRLDQLEASAHPPCFPHPPGCNWTA